MGVAYRHYLLPRPAAPRPTPDQLAALVGALRDERWIASAGELRLRLYGGGTEIPTPLRGRWLEALPREYLMAWPAAPGARDPFDLEPAPASHHELRLELADDFVYRTSEIIEPFDRPRCACGASLVLDRANDQLYYSARIAQACGSCGAACDPGAWRAMVRDSWTGEYRVVMGGATTRFAIVIDCGKSSPPRTAPARVAPALVATCQRILGAELHDLGDVY